MKKGKLPALCLFVVLAILSAVGVWKTVYISADIDESYALTMAHRIVRGDRLFVTMWEPHQLSALLYAPVVWLYETVCGGAAGILVFLRWVGVLISLAVSVCVYRILKEETPHTLALFLAALYFNFTPKHIQSPEFTSQAYWLIMLLILCLIRYERGAAKKYLILGGVCMSGLVLCYPAMLLLFLVCLIRFGMRGQRREALVFVAVCACLGAVCVLYLLAGGGARAVLSNIPNVLLDASHRQDFLLTWKAHIRLIWEMLRVTLALIIILQVGRPVLDRKNRYGKQVLAGLLFLQTVWSVWQFHTIERVNFLIFYPILFQMFVIGWYAYGFYAHDERKREWFRISMAVNLTAFLAILASSNLDANYTVPFLMPQVLFGILMIADVFDRAALPDDHGVKAEESEKETVAAKKDKISHVIMVLALLIFTVQLLTARILLVRFTSTQRYNLFAGYYQTQTGPLKGISLGEFDYRQYEAKTDALARYVKDGDMFLFVGCDMFLYSDLPEGAGIGTGNTISTPAFSEQLIRYYEVFPDRIPTVMFVDREYGADFGVILSEEPFRGFMSQYFDLDSPLRDGPVEVYTRRSAP